jgi:hypothetical protein
MFVDKQRYEFSGFVYGDFMLSIFTNISDVSIKHKSLSIKGMTYITRKQNPPA